jgi:hypothetical protein
MLCKVNGSAASGVCSDMTIFKVCNFNCPYVRDGSGDMVIFTLKHRVSQPSLVPGQKHSVHCCTLHNIACDDLSHRIFEVYFIITYFAFLPNNP